MKAKVLIIDDSRIFRSIIEQSLADNPNIEIVGSTFNGEKGIELIREKKPDVVTLDQEMPGMNGLEVLREIQKLNLTSEQGVAIKVVMISSHNKQETQITLAALEAGAFDFISKPESKDVNESIQKLKTQLTQKIYSAMKECGISDKPASTKPVFTPQTSCSVSSSIPKEVPDTQEAKPAAIIRPTKKFHYDAIVIGVSTGGPKALLELMPNLCNVTKVPILIVQHMPPIFTESLAQNLNNKCTHTIVEAKEGDEVKPQHAYIAPGGKHMILKRNGVKITTQIIDTPPENGCKPSVDVMFRTAAPIFGEKLVGMILTGMGNDGAKSLVDLKKSGAHIIAQDEASSVVWGMPGSAVATGNVDVVLPLNQIALYIAEL